MHDTALILGGLFFDRYLPTAGTIRVLDIGSLDLNGSLRQALPTGRDIVYTGVDAEPGPGVDQVVAPHARLPFDDGAFDAVVSSSCLEHDEFFWLTVDEACRVVKPGGFVYLSAPSNGHVHQHPLDCWRFYPDAGVALARWVNRDRASGFRLQARKETPDSPEARSPKPEAASPLVELVESFVFERAACEWNDTVIILGKRPLATLPEPLSRHDAAKNIRRLGSDGLGRYEPFTEDQRMMQAIGFSAHHLMATLRSETKAERLGQCRPFFSVVIAWYQGATTEDDLARCIDSVGDADAEIFVIHDGPLLRQETRIPTTRAYSLVTTPERTNQFGHDLRERGLQIADGIYVLHTNADNEYLPGALRELQAQLEAEPVGMLVAQCEMVGMERWADGSVAYVPTPDGSRDPSKVLRLSGVPPRPGTVDLMQVALRRGVALEFGFPGRSATADGELYEKISQSHGYCQSPLVIGRHY